MKTTAVMDLEISAKETARGKRVWFRSDLLLKRCGLRIGDKFRVVSKLNRIRLIKDVNGTLSVTESRGKPSFDLHNKGVSKALPSATRVFIELSLHEIVITIRRTHEAVLERIHKFKERMKFNKPLLLGDLCSGIGGLAYSLISGFIKSGQGVKAEFAVDFETATAEAAALTNPCYDKDTVIINCSIEQTPLDHINQVDILTVGLSCKGASKQARTGKKISAPEYHPEAGWLVLALPPIIIKANALVVVVENVCEWQDTVSCHMLKELMTRLGYSFKEQILQGGDFGALEHRKRYCLVFVTDGMDIDLTLPEPVLTDKTIADILEPEANFPPVPSDINCAQSDRNGWYPKSVLLEREKLAIEKGKGHRAKIINLEDMKLSTITASYGKGVRLDESTVLSKCGNWLRLMSPVEHTRAKGLPEILVSTLSKTNAHKAIGNSVEAKCWHWVGAQINKSIKNANDNLIDHLVCNEAPEYINNVLPFSNNKIVVEDVFIMKTRTTHLHSRILENWIVAKTASGELFRHKQSLPIDKLSKAESFIKKIKAAGSEINKDLWLPLERNFSI